MDDRSNPIPRIDVNKLIDWLIDFLASSKKWNIRIRELKIFACGHWNPGISNPYISSKNPESRYRLEFWNPSSTDNSLRSCPLPIIPLCLSRVEGMIHFFVGSHIKKPESGLFSDWIGNNTDDLRCSNWPKCRHPLVVVDFSLHFCLRTRPGQMSFLRKEYKNCTNYSLCFVREGGSSTLKLVHFRSFRDLNIIIALCLFLLITRLSH